MSHLRIASPRSAAVFAWICCSAVASFAQTAAARVAGQATDAAGRPIANAVIRLISDPTSRSNERTWRYTLVGDSLGKYSQEGIAPGAYLVMLFTDGKGTSVRKNVLLKGGDNLLLNLDTRPEVQVAGAIVAEPASASGPRARTTTR